MIVALGDSLTCGQGVGVHVPPERTWTALLAGDREHRLLAAPGARTRDVLAHQVPVVERAQVATLLVGLNDVVRSGFSGPAVRRDLAEAAERLAQVSDVLLLVRLHDPVRHLPVPGALRRVARERVAAVNASVDRAARDTGARVLDLEDVVPLRHRAGWAVDRVHPSEEGHAAIASAAASLLGLPVPAGVVSPVPSRAEHARWWLRHGIPYAAGHLSELGRPALGALVRR